MIRKVIQGTVAAGCLIVGIQPAHAARAAIESRTRDPYQGAIVVDAATGDVLIEDHPDAPGYPASVIKLMDLMLILDQVEQGRLSLSDPVPVTAEASGMGGSQVYLREGEQFTVDDLLYALMIQSANDAAVALALKVAGSKEGFVAQMNARAAQLGMSHTRFHSVHGLPPSAGQEPDESTPRDIAALARELILRHPAALGYTSTRERGFRDNTFIMRTHNALLADQAGCDGLKTGYFRAGGFSIAVTAQRDGRRVIAVILGSPSKSVRDQAARDLLARGFAALPPAAPAAIMPAPTATATPTASAPVAVEPAAAVEESPVAEPAPNPWRGRLLRLAGLAALVVVAFALGRGFKRDVS